MKNIKALRLVKSVGGMMALLLLSSAIDSRADLLIQGGSRTPNSDDGFAGTLVAELTSSYSANGQIGTLTSWVYSADPNDPAGFTGLTFFYQLSEDPNSLTHVTDLALNGFPDASVNVKYYNDVTGHVQPTGADLSQSTLDFLFSTPGVQAGNTSDLLIVYTADTSYAENTGSAQDGIAAPLNDLAPVPEPSSMIAGAMLLLPFGASTLRILRKNRAE